MSEVQIGHFCSCGAKLQITISSLDTEEHNQHYVAAKALIDSFEAVHRGVDGHRAVTAKECASARRRLERQRRSRSVLA